MIDKSQQDELKKNLKLMLNMEYENLPLDVLLVVSMSLTLGKNAQKVPMRRRIAWLGIPKVHILKNLSLKLPITLSNF